MSDGSGGSVKVNLDGAHLRVDARPARLVSLLRGGGDDPVLTAQRADGESHTEAVPAAARQLTFQVDRELTVEATRGSDFVALAEESGRQVVVAFNGEVTVLPTGESGDRFALGAHEALLVPADGGEPRVVPSDDLSDEDQDEISAAMEAAALGATAAPAAAAASPAQPTPGTTTTDEPTQAVPAAAIDEPTTGTPTATTDAAKGASTAGAASPTPAKAGAAAKKGPATTPARGNQANQKRGKKGKKGRPQAPAKKAAPLVPAAGAAAAGAAAGAGTAAVASGSTKKAATPVKKSTAPAKKASGKPPVKGNGHDESYEDTPGDRRFIIGAVGLAAVIAIVLAIFVLRGGDDTELATDGGTTTTEASTAPTEAPATTAAPTTAAPTTAAPTTAAAAAPTTAAPTTAPATTTTVKATTTTAAAPAVEYGIEPKSCVQNPNNSITYTATITNQSTVAFDYTVRVVFKDGSTSVASTDANVARLAPGRSVDFTATGTPNRNLTNGGQCTVERVDARPSGS